MKITFFIGGLSGGGAERVVCNLANYFTNNSHEIEILTMSDDTPSYPLAKNIKRHILLKSEERKSFLYNSYLRLTRFIRYIRKTNNDVFVVMLPITTILLLQFKIFTKAKVIASERSLPSIYKKRIQNNLKRLASKADGWVFQTIEQKEWYNNANINRYVVIPNAINPDFIKPLYEGNRNNDIVTVGSLSVPKNHELLITSFSVIAQEFPSYRLIIYGKGNKIENLKNLCANLGLKDRVFFAGYSTNIGDQIRKSSLFVLSSDYEGMPNALMEAMALGIPCVSTDCEGGGAKFLIDDGKNGLLTPRGDVNALSKAIKKMLMDKDFAEQCGKNAHLICEKLAPEKIYGEWEHFIKEIIEKK